ncbi:MAG TPA: SPFH domain-containing protein [Polyangiaceae bacterium]|jgi:regulator of protease activity HflC (stomatin/prohibitin superfamily)|nr:SPFH domain-containing protein [Polyangiaceae bacterium]
MITKTARGASLAVVLACAGCSTSTIEPGHRGLYFAPNAGGLRHDILPPGTYRLGFCFLACTSNRVDDFDVTFSTRTENIHTKSAEGLDLDLKLSVIYRPIVSELYQLDTEIGANYYDEVIGPEFKSACRGVFARHSYTELQARNEAIEDEVEGEVRRRTAGRHVEISSVTLETVNYAPEIADKIRQKIAGEQEAARERAAIEWDAEKKKQLVTAEAIQKKLELENETAQERLVSQKQAETARFKAEQDLAAIETERKVTKAQGEIARLRAESEATKKIIDAKASAEAAIQMARAHAEDRKAETAGVTPMEVMLHAYDALSNLGGTGTTIMLGDWSHVPNFLFPRVPSLQGAFTLPYNPYAAPPSPASPTGPAATRSWSLPIAPASPAAPAAP